MSIRLWREVSYDVYCAMNTRRCLLILRMDVLVRVLKRALYMTTIISYHNNSYVYVVVLPMVKLLGYPALLNEA